MGYWRGVIFKADIGLIGLIRHIRASLNGIVLGLRQHPPQGGGKAGADPQRLGNRCGVILKAGIGRIGLIGLIGHIRASLNGMCGGLVPAFPP